MHMASQSCICVDYLIFNTVFRGRRYLRTYLSSLRIISEIPYCFITVNSFVPLRLIRNNTQA